MVLDSLRYFFHADEPIELRFLGVEHPGRTHAGWITLADIDRVRNMVKSMADRTNGVYFTPQVLTPAVLSRSSRGHFGTVRKQGKETTPKLTSDLDVVARRYLIVDVDPTKPDEHKHDSATDDEKDAALSVTSNVRLWLTEMGWPAPLVVDSGNGYHCYYRLPALLSGGEIARPELDPLAKLLRTLARKVDTTGATIDTKVFNPSRIMKLPGTWSRKGDDSKDRPHRLSKILEIPDDWKIPCQVNAT